MSSRAQNAFYLPDRAPFGDGLRGSGARLQGRGGGLQGKIIGRHGSTENNNRIGVSQSRQLHDPIILYQHKWWSGFLERLNDHKWSKSPAEESISRQLHLAIILYQRQWGSCFFLFFLGKLWMTTNGQRARWSTRRFLPTLTSLQPCGSP